MFTRRASQKPSDDLYLSFKARFSHRSQNSELAPSTTAQAPPANLTSTALADALDAPALHNRPGEPQPHEIKDADTTPRGPNDPWNFGPSGLTPSMMDPNSHSFNMFANQMPGYYTPTPGGTNTHYHNQAGDLHTPGFGMGLGTPLSMPTSEGALHAGQQAAAYHHGFPGHLPQHIPPQHFHDVNSFQMHQTQAFPPQQFSHQPCFDSMESGVGESPIDDLGMDLSIHQSHSHHQSPEAIFRPSLSHQESLQPLPAHQTGEKFRYHVTLNAPTAMIKHAEEIPITYLNKGQAYTLNVKDTNFQHVTRGTKYRTFVRVSFEDEQQRQKPGACWQLWKEGRGTNEAHQRGGRLQAVEFVDPGQLGGIEDASKPKIDLECASFDGFCVTWTPAVDSAECGIAVRFNFLSTDFSHSKGVKGIPVRLCAKTEAVVDDMSLPTQSNEGEVCYCKVKLFRDHGAERKLANDVAHVRKTIDKLNQQVAQIESGMKDFGKRKRSGSVAKNNTLDQRPGKVLKHRRTWSMTSVTSNGGRGSAEEDLHIKLMTLQDMFTSTRPASVLYLRGDNEDDPDAYPVKIPGEAAAELHRNDSGETSGWDLDASAGAGIDSSLVSPTPSSSSLVGSRRDFNMQQPTPIGGSSRNNSNEWRSHPQTATVDIQPTIPEQFPASPDTKPIKVQTRPTISGASTTYIEAVGIDVNYKPPPERPIKPVACFYVQPSVSGRPPLPKFHRAIYLMNRTLKDFNITLARKCNIEPTQVFRTYRVNADGLQILFDDDCIRELPEGQDMKAEFWELEAGTPIKPQREWNAGPTDVQMDGDLSVIEATSSMGYELRLLF